MPFKQDGPEVWFTGWFFDEETREHLPTTWRAPSWRWYPPEYHEPFSQFKELQAMKREHEENQRKATKWTAPSDPFWKKYPKLAEYLSDAWFDDGKPRECPQLTIRVFQDQCLVSIVDIDRRRSTQTTGKTLEDALTLVEALCSSLPLPWREWGGKRK